MPIIGITGRVEQASRPPHLNLFASPQDYVKAVAESGGVPVVIPPHLEKKHLRVIFHHLDGLILSGGGDIHPSLFGERDSGLLWSVDQERDRCEMLLAQWALEDRLPVLAICRGIQVLNVVCGGTLIQDIPSQVPNPLPHSFVTGRSLDKVIHTIKIERRSRLAEIAATQEMGVNSAHHQAVKDVGTGLCVTAKAPDGVIEGIEAVDHPFCIGVQWHPETMFHKVPVMQRFFVALVDAAEDGS